MDEYLNLAVTADDLEWLISQASHGLAFTGKRMADRVALITRMGIVLEGFSEEEDDDV